jgi:hypothetical protein
LVIIANNLKKLERYLLRQLKSYIVEKSYWFGSGFYKLRVGSLNIELTLEFGNLFKTPSLSFRFVTRDQRHTEIAKKLLRQWVKTRELEGREILVEYRYPLWSALSLSPHDYEEDREQIKLIKKMIEEIMESTKNP